jgi:hypothetical protein
MSAYDTFKTGILGDPFDSNKKPSRQQTVQAFKELQDQVDAFQSSAVLGYANYASTAAGIAGTVDGESFTVFITDYLVVYLNVSEVATEQGRIPLSSLIDLLEEKIDASDDAIFVFQDQISNIQKLGKDVLTTGSAYGNTTTVFGDKIEENGVVRKIEIYGRGDYTVQLKRFEFNGTSWDQVGSDEPLEISSGLNVFKTNYIVEKGERIGLYTPGDAISWNPSPGPSGGFTSSGGNVSNVSNTVNNSVWTVMFSFEIYQIAATLDKLNVVEENSKIRIPVHLGDGLTGNPIVSNASGALKLTEPDYGLTFPVGQTGNGSFFQLPLPLFDESFENYNNETIELTAYFNVENYVARTFATGIFKAATSTANLLSFSHSFDAEKKELKWVFIVESSWLTSDKTSYVRPFAQFQGGSAAASEIEVKLKSMYWKPVSSIEAGPEQQKMFRETIRKERKLKQTLPGSDYVIITANSDVASSDDFTGKQAIQNAIDSISDASEDKQYQIVCTGDFAASEIADFTKTLDGSLKTFVHTKSFVHLLGTGSGCNLVGGVPSGTPNLSLYDVLREDSTSIVENFFINGTNIKYGTHFEGAGGTPNFQRTWKAVHVKSNTSAALGYGASSGEVSKFENSTFETDGSNCVYIHDNKNFKQPAIFIFENCNFILGSTAGWSLQLQSLGAGVKSIINLKNCNLPSGFGIRLLDSWFGKAKLNHSEMQLVANENEPRAVSTSDMKTNCLLIISDTTGITSSVVVDEGSDAFDLIFGKSYQDVEFIGESGRLSQYGCERLVGGVGFSGRVFSGLDIGETNRPSGGNYSSSLGKRLGDCSSSNKTLTVTVDGGSPINIVFDKNYDGTGSTSAPNFNNSSILAEINAAISGDATAYLIPYGRYFYPKFKGIEKKFNGDSFAIEKGMGVVFTSLGSARIATSSDLKIDGIAIEDAFVNAKFKIIACGEIFTQFSNEWFSLNETSSVDHAFGVKLGIDASNPGLFSTSGPNKVLEIVAPKIAKII